MKLKTLKDLPKEVIGIEEKMISSEKLKSEACKWVKKEAHAGGVVDWIKHFFNITEEDLK